MFGISWAEFFVILLAAVLVVPARLWPDVARFLARLVNAVRRVMWKISDISENLKQQIDLEKPIDDLIQNTTCFSKTVTGKQNLVQNFRPSRNKSLFQGIGI